MKITLLKPHTHAGQKLKPGDVLDLPHSVATWLIERGIAAHPGGEQGSRAPARTAGTTTRKLTTQPEEE